MKTYTANKCRSKGRKFYTIIFRHPVRKDSGGRSGLRIRRGLGTPNPKVADMLVNQMNELLSNSTLWNLESKPIAEKLYDQVIISAFYEPLETISESYIIVYESGLGKGWNVIEAIDAKDALKKFEGIEPDIYKLCQYPYGKIRVAKEEKVGEFK